MVRPPMHSPPQQHVYVCTRGAIGLLTPVVCCCAVFVLLVRVMPRLHPARAGAATATTALYQKLRHAPLQRLNDEARSATAHPVVSAHMEAAVLLPAELR